MGGPSRPKDCLGGKHTLKYFGEQFMIPWAKNVLKNNPNLDDIVLPLLHAEMQRLEELAKQTKKGSKVKTSGQASCSARKCGFPNGTVNLSNVGVYGTCGRCNKHEHFRCAKIKDEEKEEIVAGNQTFCCSGCLFKFPLEVAYNKPKTTIGEGPRKEVVNDTNSIEDLTIDDQIDSIEVLAVVHEEPEQRSATYQCEMCEYNVDFEDEIKRHMCKKLFWDSTVCNAHKDTCLVSITIKCKTCDFVTGKLAGLMKHKAEKHQFKCDKCEWKVSSSKELDQHKLYVHAHK